MANTRKLTNESQLRELYCDKFLSRAAIAKQLGVGCDCVTNSLRRMGISLRPPTRKTDSISKADLERLYFEKGYSFSQLAKVLHISSGSVQRLFLRHNIKSRSRSESLAKERHPLWKGGRSLEANGYISVPTQGGKRQYEHRLVMEEHLGRKLLRSEHVHHINGIKTDNRVENLQVMDGVSHFRDTIKHKFMKHADLKTENKSLRRRVDQLNARVKRLQEQLAIAKAKI